MCMDKIRVNITVDRYLLKKAKKKLGMFGGKLSGLFNAYLADFVKTIDNKFSKDNTEGRVNELESRLKRIEDKVNYEKKRVL